jgi:hypothetical protein
VNAAAIIIIAIAATGVLMMTISAFRASDPPDYRRERFHADAM